MTQKPALAASLDLFGEAVTAREGRPGRLSGAAQKTPTVERRCELCPKVSEFEGRTPGWRWVITDTNEPVSQTTVSAIAARARVVSRDLCGDPMQLGGPVATQDRTGD